MYVWRDCGKGLPQAEATSLLTVHGKREEHECADGHIVGGVKGKCLRYNNKGGHRLAKLLLWPMA